MAGSGGRRGGRSHSTQHPKAETEHLKVLTNISQRLSKVIVPVLTCNLPLLFRLLLVGHDADHDPLIVLSQLEVAHLPLGAHLDHVLVALHDGVALQLGGFFAVTAVQQQSLCSQGAKSWVSCVHHYA